MASHIECRFNKNSLLQCNFLAILPAWFLKLYYYVMLSFYPFVTSLGSITSKKVEEWVFVESVFNMQCHLVKNTLLHNAFSANLTAGYYISWLRRKHQSHHFHEVFKIPESPRYITGDWLKINANPACTRRQNDVVWTSFSRCVPAGKFNVPFSSKLSSFYKTF